METTKFLSAIEEDWSVSDSQEAENSGVAHHATTEERSKNSDSIDSGAYTEPAKPRKQRHVDQFFANQVDACLLSPIKSASAAEEIIDREEESLDLKLVSLECTAHPQEQTRCVQPENLTFTITEDTFARLVEEAREDRSQDDCPLLANLCRESPRGEMEAVDSKISGAARAATLPRREEQSADLDSKTEKNSSDSKIGEEPAETDGPGCGDEDEEIDSQSEAVESTHGTDRVKPCRRCDMTLDMTLRTSGGVAFATGLFLAIDEALDPLVGVLLPHGRRLRGVNIFVACIPIILAIYFLFIR